MQLQSTLFLVPIIELVILYFLSRIVFSKLAQFFQELTSRTKWIYYSLALLFLPGTYVHELSHYLMAKILFVPVYGFSLRPKIVGKELHLGHVEVAKTDFLRRFLVGIAPMLFGTIILVESMYFLFMFNKTRELIYIIGEGVLVFEVANTMFMSKKDMEGSWKVGVIVIIIVAILYVIGFQVNSLLPFLQSHEQLFINISKYLLVPTIVNVILISILSLIV